MQLGNVKSAYHSKIIFCLSIVMKMFNIHSPSSESAGGILHWVEQYKILELNP